MLNPLSHGFRLARPLPTYCHCAGDQTVPRGVGVRGQDTLFLYLPDLLGDHLVTERKTRGTQANSQRTQRQGLVPGSYKRT